jgi:NAD(P)-dependent dehydrogenase (short-subunit alcohol dehydrogenase family)
MDAETKRVAVVTGGSRGIGREIVKRLCRSGVAVCFSYRQDAQAAAAVVEELRATGATVQAMVADARDAAASAALVEKTIAEHGRLDILINNAGIGRGPPQLQARELSRDGHELRFAVNYLSGFLLTHMLLPTLRRSAPARIVNVSSAGQYPIDFEDVMLARGYEGTRAYRQSKLAQVMFTIDLAEQLKDAGITVNCLHPATFMNTNMVIESGYSPTSSVEEGADAILHLAASSELKGTTVLYFDGQRQARANAQAYDAAARRRLWDLSLRLTGLSMEPAAAV